MLDWWVFFSLLYFLHIFRSSHRHEFLLLSTSLSRADSALNMTRNIRYGHPIKSFHFHFLLFFLSLSTTRKKEKKKNRVGWSATLTQSEIHITEILLWHSCHPSSRKFCLHSISFLIHKYVCCSPHSLPPFLSYIKEEASESIKLRLSPTSREICGPYVKRNILRQINVGRGMEDKKVKRYPTKVGGCKFISLRTYVEKLLTKNERGKNACPRPST